MKRLLIILLFGVLFLSAVAEASDAIIAYRSNTGVSTTSSPKIRFWNSSLNGSWGSELELPTAGSPVRWAVAKWSPVSDKIAVVSLSDDGNLDGYVCMTNCTDVSNWNATNNIGNVWAAAAAQRRFDIDFETTTGDLVLVYGVYSTNTSRDLAYKVLPASQNNFSGLTEQYLDDSGHATDIQYTWVRLDRKPTASEELLLVAFDLTDTDINSWVWNGSAWNNQTEISSTASATSNYEALAVRYATDGSMGMSIGANGTSGGVDWRYWNGASWSAVSFFDIDSGDVADARWINLKPDPKSDDLQAVIVDSLSDLHTTYWDGSSWNVTSNIDVGLDVNSRRPADFAWNPTGSTGQLVFDTDGAGTTLSTVNCTPRCNNTVVTAPSFTGTGYWITMWTNPTSSDLVGILSARLITIQNDIGAFMFNGTNHSNYGDTAISAATTVDTFECYSIAFNVTDRTPPAITFIPQTPDNNTVIYVNQTFINTSITDNIGVYSALLEWNGTNESMDFSSGAIWYKNKTGLVPGVYMYWVWASDYAGNWNVSETRRLVYGTPPNVTIIDPLGQAFDQHSFVPIAINVSDTDGINLSITTVTMPNGTPRNITLYQHPYGDYFETGLEGISWVVENSTVGPAQTCVADINGTVPGMAFTSLTGDGSPNTDTLCSFVSNTGIYGDFDMNISFQVLASGNDTAMNFQVMEGSSSAEATKLAFISLSNWTGLGRNYEVFVSDGNISDYIARRSTDDSYGKFRIMREADNFSFYSWNNTGSSWILENSTILNLSKGLFVAFESESAYPGWGAMNASWDNYSVSHENYTLGFFNETALLGQYNVSIYVRDNLGAVNGSERTNFTITQVNDPPSTPFILAPGPGTVLYGLYNITWSQVTDEENDSVRFNITLLNPDYSFNSTIISGYGGISTSHYEWNTSEFADGTYSLEVLVYENETVQHLSSSYTLPGTFLINNSPNMPPAVIVVEPLGGTYPDNVPVPIAINATDPDGINASIATIYHPLTNISENLTLYLPSAGDNFDSDTIGTAWWVENGSIGPSQACIADINTTLAGKAFTSLNGDGSPLSDTLCSLVSNRTVYGDFDMNVSFEILSSEGVDNAINFQVMEMPSSANATVLAFISLSNWTGLGRNYEVFVDDGNVSEYIATRPTDDTYGKFRIQRVGDNFSFHTWNNTAGSWVLENSSTLNLSKALFVSFESESAYAGWGTMNASWENLSISSAAYWSNVFYDPAHPAVLHNVTFYVNDSRGAANDSEKTNFTLSDANNPPSKPFLLAPYPGATIDGQYNITWSSVSDPDNDSVRFNITLLNSGGSDNGTIVSEYGSISSNNYEWDTTAYPDGEYSMRVTVYENETAEGLSNSYTMMGTFHINNNVPQVVIIEPLGGSYEDMKPVPIAINATDTDGINATIATVSYPNGTMENITLMQCSGGDNFDSDSVGTGWWVENTSIGPSQACTADINGTVPGKAFTSLSGSGSPLSDTLCSLVSHRAIYGDFDMNVSFEILASPWVDNAINFQVMEVQSSANASYMAFISLSNWTGLGRNYEVFVEDGTTSGYIATRPTDDTYGKFRIKREGNNFTFYTWNNTDSSWILENSTTLDFINVLYVAMESESAYSGWGTMNASWDNLSIEHDESYFGAFNTNVHPLGQYNISFYVNDSRGAVNDTERSNFTIIDVDDPPSKPFILTPPPGSAIQDMYNITWSGVSDPDGDSLRFNITLLNSDGSDNDTIAGDYGNSSSVYYEWDTTAYPDGEYSMRVTVYENETAQHLSNSYTLMGTFYINNNAPSVVVLHPLGQTFNDGRAVAVSINATDPGGISSAIASISMPNGTVKNITLGSGQGSDDFDNDTIGTAWFVEDMLVGPSQTCTADIDTTLAGMAYTSLSGDGSPESDTLCSLISMKALDADFDIQIDFSITEETGTDVAMNLELTEFNSSAEATRMIFISLSNWTGYGRNYEVFVDDGNFSDYVLTRPTDDTYGKFRIRREANNFTFYTWNNTASAWNEENVSQNEFNFSRAVYVSFESESAFPGWGTMSVGWDNFTVSSSSNTTFAVFTDTWGIGVYNVSFNVSDAQGRFNDSERTNFTIVEANDPPSKPFILTPYPGNVIEGPYNITWSQVNDKDGDSLRFNITLLNPDLSYNSPIVSDYGDVNSTFYEWDTAIYPDGYYAMEVVVFENETAEGLSNTYTLTGNFTVDNNAPAISFEPPTEMSGSIVSRNYVQVNVSAEDVTLNLIEILLYNSSLDLINTSYSSASSAFGNFTGLPDGLYFFNATALDVLGRENFTETRNITITENCPVITSGGTYVQENNYSGAPNSVTGMPVSYACVLIMASDVSYSCAGYSIKNNGTAGSAAIAVNGSQSAPYDNVTITDCPMIIGYTTGINIQFSSNDTLSDNVLVNNTYRGVHVTNSSNMTILDSVGYSHQYYGFHFESCDGGRVSNSVGYNNSRNGFRFDYSNGTNFTNNTAYNNTLYGFRFTDSNGMHLIENVAYENYLDGFILQNSNDSIIFYNNATYNNGSGILFYDRCNNNTFYQNNGSFNNASGFHLNNNCTNNNITENHAMNNTLYGFNFMFSDNNTAVNNTANLNVGSGLYLRSSQSVNLTGNTVYDNEYGMLGSLGANFTFSRNNVLYRNVRGISFSESYNNTFINDTAYDNSGPGAYITSCGNNSFINMTGHNNTYSLYVLNSNDTNITNFHSYDSRTADFRFGVTDADPRSLWASNLTLDSPFGSMENYTSLSITDMLDPASTYVIKWAANSSPIPDNHTSFAQKFVNISNISGTVSIDSITWHWQASELAGYDENRFELWKYNSSGWAGLNYTPNTSANTLSLSSMNPASIYGILEKSVEHPVTFVPPTPANGTLISDAYAPVNVSINYSSPDTFIFNWNGTNTTIRHQPTNDTNLVFVLFLGSRTHTITLNLTPESQADLETGFTLTLGSLNVLVNGNNVGTIGTLDSSPKTFANISQYLVEGENMITYSGSILTSGIIDYSSIGASSWNYFTNKTGLVNGTYTYFAWANNSAGASNYSFGADDGLQYSQSTPRYLTINTSAVTSCRAISSPGSYQLPYNLNGSTVNASPVSGMACVKITSPDVVLACNGYNITGNDSSVTTYGILTASATNVTVMNCGGVSNYTNAIYLYNTNASRVINNTAFNSSYGIQLTASNNVNVSGCSAYDITENGFYVYLNSSGNLVSNSTARDSSAGFAISYTSAGNVLDNNTARANTYGFILSFDSSANAIANNTAADNALYGFEVFQSSNSTFSNNSAYGTGYGFYIHDANGTYFISNTAHSSMRGFFADNVSGVSLENNTAYNNTGQGFYVVLGSGNNLSGNLAYGNALAGLWLANSTDNSVSGNNLTNNSFNGVALDVGSTNNLLSSNYVCFNDILDVNNSDASNSGALDRCDYWQNWTENGHAGCEYTCSEVWHRFFGNVSGRLLLAPNNAHIFYNWLWDGRLGKIYAVNSDASISWANLTALGRNTTGQNSTDDFSELDSMLGMDGLRDSITELYTAGNGSVPTSTLNMTLWNHDVPYVPQANSSTETAFQTGIAWDASEDGGGGQFDPADDEDVAFVTGINGTAQHDYDIRVPEALSTYKGASGMVSFWVELE